ncbi:MAG: M55 family metallopeptidase [Candidatus Firestonebacteria bacterium]
MKIYIFTDIEGVGGVHLYKAQTRPDGKYYDEACQLLTKEINAAVEGAFLGGASEVLVCDSHYYGANIDLELLDERARLARGPKKKGSWGCGIDKSYAGVVFIGAHAMAGTEDAVLDHTMSSIEWQNLWLNGELLGEIGLGAYFYGEFGVPMIFVSGDDKACKEAKKLIKGVYTVETKIGVGREAAIFHPLKKVRENITEGVRKAVENAGKFKPLKPKYPVTFKLEYKSTFVVDGIHPVPGRRITGPRTVEYKPKSVRDFLNYL